MNGEAGLAMMLRRRVKGQAIEAVSGNRQGKGSDSPTESSQAVQPSRLQDF